MNSKPFSDFIHEQNNSGIGLRGPDGGIIRSPSKPKRATMIESDSESQTPSMDTESPKSPEPRDITTLKKSTFGRGRPKLFRDRTSPNSHRHQTLHLRREAAAAHWPS